MKIIELHAENIKRIRVVTITPTTNVIRVNGRNGSGKTSTLDSILWALQGAGSVDLVPVHEGCERGMIRLTLGDANDAQVWIERVGADDVGIVLEDGEVVAVDGRPVDRLQSGELTQDAD